MLSALGVGSMRFKIDTDDAIANAVQIVLEAVQSGVNYIDTSYGYLGGKAEKIVGAALKQTEKKCMLRLKLIIRLIKHPVIVIRGYAHR
jgi:predicted aldo/keto reductase-like oxidoreductase